MSENQVAHLKEGTTMTTTTRITKVLKITEFADFSYALQGCVRFDNDWNKLIDFLQTQTEAKQNKFWAFHNTKEGN